jgi:hypothetical protein
LSEPSKSAAILFSLRGASSPDFPNPDFGPVNRLQSGRRRLIEIGQFRVAHNPGGKADQLSVEIDLDRLGLFNSSPAECGA